MVIPPEDIQQSRYALAAFLDEMILSSPWDHREEWSARTLQYEFFKEQVAGEEFFNRLEAFRRALPLNSDLLEVYYLCMILGFEGKFKIHGKEKLKDLIETVGQELRAKRGEVPVLSPHGRRPEEFMEMVKQGLPSWVVLVSGFAAVFFFYLVISLVISGDANQVLGEILYILEVNR